MNRLLSTLAALAALLIIAPLTRAAETTPITDIVYLADGTTAPVGSTITISWPRFTSASNRTIPKGSKTVTIGSDGSFTISLEPTDTAAPEFSYTVRYNIVGQSPMSEYWSVPTSTSPQIIQEIAGDTGTNTAPIVRLVSKGQIPVFDGTNMQALTPGSNGTVLVADSSDAKGVKWGAVSSVNGVAVDGYKSIPDPALRAWRQALSTGTANILLLGDSISAGSGATIARVGGFAYRLANHLHAAYGNAGDGINPVWDVSTPNDNWTSAGSWVGVPGVGPSQSGTSAINNVLKSSTTTDSLTLSNVYASSVDLYALESSDSTGCSVQIDGGSATQIATGTTGTYTWTRTNVSAGSLGTHTVTIKPIGGGQCYFAGAAPIASSSGVTLNNYAHSSFRSDAYSTSAKMGFTSVMPHVDLLIAQLEINDISFGAGGVSGFQSRIDFIAQQAASLGSSCLIVGESNTTSYSLSDQAPYDSALRAEAALRGCAYFSMAERWGAESVANAAGLMAGDGTHPNDSGHKDYQSAYEQRILDSSAGNWGIYQTSVAPGLNVYAGSGYNPNIQLSDGAGRSGQLILNTSSDNFYVGTTYAAPLNLQSNNIAMAAVGQSNHSLQLNQQSSTPGLLVTGGLNPHAQVSDGSISMDMLVNTGGGVGNIGTQSNNSFQFIANNAPRAKVNPTGTAVEIIQNSINPGLVVDGGTNPQAQVSDGTHTLTLQINTSSAVAKVGPTTANTDMQLTSNSKVGAIIKSSGGFAINPMTQTTPPTCSAAADLGTVWIDTTNSTTAVKFCVSTAGTIGWKSVSLN